MDKHLLNLRRYFYQTTVWFRVTKNPAEQKAEKFWLPSGIYGMIVAFLSITAYLYLALVVSS
jgi:hypothetical protein